MSSPQPTAGRRPDTGDVRAVHSGLRREFRVFPDLLIDALAAGDGVRTSALRDHWTLIADFLDRHHEGEDDILWPLLEELSPDASGIVSSMKEQHDGMLATLEAAEVAVAGCLRSGPLPDDLATLRRLAEEIDEHFDAEEAQVLPLCQAHLSAEEWERLGVHGRAGTPPGQMPVIACLIMEDADDEARAAFLAPMPAEVQALATGPWQEEYARYVALLRGS